MSERLTKKQLKQDRFLQTIYTAWAYAQDNVAVVVAGSVGVVALVVLGVRVGGSTIGGTERGNPEAERALSAARTQFLSGRPDAGLAALDDLRSRQGGTRAGKEATYLLANALYESGDYARALQVFQDFLRKPLHDDLMLDGARLAVAACREESGDLAAAAADYLVLWKESANPATRAQAGVAAARCAAAQGQNDRARELYQSVADAYSGSPEGQQAAFRLLEIEHSSAG